jgi:hypothetical protein
MRAVDVVPPSPREEALAVGRWVLVIAYLSILALAVEIGGGDGGAPSARLPYQQLFKDQAANDQRIFRELQEGLLEAENLRATEGRWPAAARLAELGVPPFGPDSIDAAVYRWESAIAPLAASYIGHPVDAGRKSFLLLVQEPGERARSLKEASALLDEVHHALPDGELIHVSTWIRAAAPPATPDPVERPAEQGWTQIVVGKPGER